MTCIVGLVHRGTVWIGGDTLGSSSWESCQRADMRYMATDFIEAIRGTLKTGGYTVVKDNQESGGTFLVGHAGRIFRIEDDFQVGEARIGFDAVGCGFAYALGSLWESRGKRPRDRVRRALEAAERFSGAVQRPFTILRLA